MSNEKKKKTYYLSSETISKVVKVSEETKESQSAIVESAIDDYIKNYNEQYLMIKEIVTELLNERTEPISRLLEKMMLAVNSIDRQQKVNLELMNHHLYIETMIDSRGEFSHERLYDTSKNKVIPFQKAEVIVQNEIASLRTKKQDGKV